jgi:hypothetical protein
MQRTHSSGVGDNEIRERDCCRGKDLKSREIKLNLLFGHYVSVQTQNLF